MKTLEGWENSDTKTIYEYLSVGDEVDEEMIDYFRDILPPTTINAYMLQVGEPSDCINGRNTYTTFIKENSKWKFKGDCFKGGILK